MFRGTRPFYCSIVEARDNDSQSLREAIEVELRDTYGMKDTYAIYYLLKNSDDETVKSFIHRFYSPEGKSKKRETIDDIGVDEFVSIVSKSRKEPIDNNRKKRITNKLEELFGNDAAKALSFLLSRSDMSTVRNFAGYCFGATALADKATVEIIVRKNNARRPARGNTGSYLIFTKKGDSAPVQLSFTHQASKVFYLMYLICHKVFFHRDDAPVNLGANTDGFMQLYQKVYPQMSEDEVLKRYHDLLFREDASGNIRAGRANEIIHDIRKRLKKAFEAYGESFTPYAMTAHSHLRVHRSLIHFEGEAADLLNIRFFSFD